MPIMMRHLLITVNITREDGLLKTKRNGIMIWLVVIIILFTAMRDTDSPERF